MKKENRVCNVCKYRFKVQQLGIIEFVPPNIEVYTYNTLNQALLEVFVNFAFYAQAIMIIPDVWSNGTYYDHAAYQILYLLCHYIFAYFRYYRLVQNKKLYLSLLDNEVKNFIGIQIAVIFGLLFVHNVVYHYSAVFLATYIRQPVLYSHYKALKAVNDRLEYRFLEPKVPSAALPSSS